MRTLLVFALALGLAGQAAADSLDEKRVLSGKTVLDPTMGYIFLYGTGRQGGTFIRVPDAEDLAAYNRDRDEQFTKARKRYQKKLKSWEVDAAAAAKAKTKPPEKPVEPTLENFSIGPVEARTVVQFGPDFAYLKDKARDRYSYAMSAKPGTYIWYGPIVFDPNQGQIGVCYCMGTVKFDVKPGVVTNLGNFLTAAPLAEQQKIAPLLDIRHSGGLSGFRVEVPVVSMPTGWDIPASLAGWPTVQPEFTASGKLNNVYGVMISRLPPVPGVLAYDRDQVIDARNGTVLPNGF